MLCMTYLLTSTYLHLPLLPSSSRLCVQLNVEMRFSRTHALSQGVAGRGAWTGGETTRHVKWEYYSFYFSDRAAYVIGEGGQGERVQEELVETISRNYHSEMENN